MDIPPLRYWRRIEGGMYRFDETACGMRCVFCPTSVGSSPPFDRNDVGRAERVVGELEAILAATPREAPIRLTADDLLTFDGFLEVLEVFRRHGRRFEIDTPGLRLADAEFAAAVSRYDVHLTVSCQAASEELYTAMTGNPCAFGLVRAALINLRRYAIPFGVNCVVTAINCGAVFDIARFLLVENCLPTFNLLHFYPEQFLLDLAPNAWDLLPPYQLLDKQLARVGALCTALDKRVRVFDVAPCQLRSRVVANPRVFLDFVHGPRFEADSPSARHRSPSCDPCILGDRCSTISQRYIERDPHMRFDAERVRRDLAIRQRLLPWKA